MIRNRIASEDYTVTEIKQLIALHENVTNAKGLQD